MNFRAATYEDLDYMATNSINQKVDRKMEECVEYVYALEHDGVLLGVGGFRIIVPQTAWIWVDLSEDGVKNVRASYRVMLEWMTEWAETHNIKRLQAFVRDSEKEIRLVKHLGFTQESTMTNFYGDDDALMYVRIF